MIKRSIITLSVCLVTAGCAGKDKPSPAELEAHAFDDLRSEMRVVISDSERRETAIGIANQLEDSFEHLRAHLAERSQKVRALNADYDAPKQDYLDLFSEIQQDTQRNQSHISELHRQLLEVTTAQEWEDLKKLRNAAMEATVASIQSG